MAKSEHCYYAFDVLQARLDSASRPPFPQDGHSEYPLFVTWNTNTKSSPSKWRLRGCIGNFSAMRLDQGLAEYAIISALKDHRFSPITLSELPRLQCCVSLLIDFEDCDDCYDWQVGVHGIRIHFQPPSPQHGRKQTSAFSACFLPEVAESAGWDKRETLEAAIHKAGYNGPVTDDLLNSIQVERFQSSKVAVTYDQWKAWKASRS